MTVANLPNDLESEILARVPAKSLWELRATCKRWYALFRDPKFVEKNKKMSGEAARESMLLSNREVYSIAGDLHNSEPSPLEFTGKLSKDLDLDTISHCDGLILCQAKDNSSVVVWNPCTGETKTIEPRTCYRNSDRFALGYSNSRSYKILRCDHHLNEEKVWTVETEMYDLCSDFWRILDSCALDYEVYCSGVSLRGDTYFVAAGFEDSAFFLMKFDFTEERFVRLPLPFQRLGPEDTGVLSVVRDEKLSVSHQHIVWSNMMSIWVTNKVDGEGKEISWKKDFVFEVDFDKFELPCTVNVFSFVLDEEKKVAVCCEVCDDDEDSSRPKMRTTIFIVGEDMYKRVYNIGNGSYHGCPLVLSYVPSLFHIQ